MTYRLGLALTFIVCACQEERRDDPAPADDMTVAGRPAAPPTPEPPANASASVMRPSVLAEAEPEAPAPVAPPTRAVVRFAERGVDLSEQARATIDGLLTPERLAGTSAVILRGHSDTRGTDEQNRTASLRRAEAVRDHLVERGVSSDRIRVIALGETRPVAPNATPDGDDYPEGRARNRRVEVQLEAAAAGAAPTDADSGELTNMSSG